MTEYKYAGLLRVIKQYRDCFSNEFLFLYGELIKDLLAEWDELRKALEFYAIIGGTDYVARTALGISSDLPSEG